MTNIDFAEVLKRSDEILLSAPLGVSLEITSRCNLKCMYCYTDAGETHVEELEKREILDLIDHFYSIGVGVLVFTGGEPLCRPDFLEIARYANEQDFTIRLSTNGTLLDEDTAQAIHSSGFSNVQVSVEGNERQHEALTGIKGSYKKALNALENLERAGTNCFVTTTITALNYKDIISHIEKIYNETPAFGIRLLRFLPMGRGKTVCDLEVPAGEIEKLYYKIQEIGKKIRKSFGIHFSEAFNAPAFDRPSHPCIGGYSWCCVTPDGYVVPCNYFSSSDVTSILGADNIREKEFIDIWRSSSLLQRFRNPHNELKGKCTKCDVSAECRGGCRAVSFSYTGDLFNQGSFCSYSGE